MKLRHRLRLVLVIAGLVALVIGAGQIFADFSYADWPYVKTVGLPSGLATGGLVELFPDAQVYANSNTNLTDLRIVSNDGLEIPYKFEVSRGHQERKSVPATLRDSGYVQGQYTTFVADLGPTAVLHNEIEFQSSSTNFNRTATIETSADGKTWVVVGEEPVYDLSVEGVGRVSHDTRLQYDESSAQYIRVRIADQGDGSLEVQAASVYFVDSTPARETQWPVSILSVAQDTELRATVVDVDIGADGLPSHRLALRVPNVNFQRRVNVQASENLERWQGLTSNAAIYSYVTSKFVGSDLTISYSETTARYLRILIFNEDDSPLDVQGVEVWGFQRRLVFSADPEQEYKLYYGNSEASRPSYDFEMLFPYMDTKSILEASLSGQTESELYQPPAPPEPKPIPLSERLPWLLPVVIGMAAAVVGLLLLGVVRRAKSLLPPPAQ